MSKLLWSSLESAVKTRLDGNNWIKNWIILSKRNGNPTKKKNLNNKKNNHKNKVQRGNLVKRLVKRALGGTTEQHLTCTQTECRVAHSSIQKRSNWCVVAGLHIVNPLLSQWLLTFSHCLYFYKLRWIKSFLNVNKYNNNVSISICHKGG